MNLFALNKGIRDMHKDSGEGNGKSVAAVKILENVMKRGKPIIQFYEHVSELYMELANLKVTQPEGKGNRRSPTIVKWKAKGWYVFLNLVFLFVYSSTYPASWSQTQSF